MKRTAAVAAAAAAAAATAAAAAAAAAAEASGEEGFKEVDDGTLRILVLEGDETDHRWQGGREGGREGGRGNK